MIFRILLLINLISWIHGTLVVDVTQTSYQTEENQNVTLKWTFTTRPDMSSKSIFIYCKQFIGHRSSVLLHVHEGVEVSESQDEQFTGRVQFDKDVLREGRIRLQLARLRTNDSGVYRCDVRTDDGSSFDRCRLTVGDASVQQELISSEEILKLIPVMVLVLLLLGLTAAAFFALCINSYIRARGQRSNYHQV